MKCYFLSLGLAFLIACSVSHQSSSLTKVSGEDLIKIYIPTRLIYRWDSSYTKEINDSLPFYPEAIRVYGRTFLSTVQPMILKIDKTKNTVLDTLWIGKQQYDIDDKAAVFIEIPYSLIDTSKDIILSFKAQYAANIKKSAGGRGFFREIISQRTITTLEKPFPFKVESEPKNAELYYIDQSTWDFHESQLRGTFEVLNKIYDLRTIRNNKVILDLLSRYINPTGYGTPTEIYLFDTPYVLFAKLNDKVFVTRLIPSRDVTGMNRKSIKF